MDWMKYRKLYFSLSGIFIAIGIFSHFKWGLRIGVDFKGGSVIEYRFDNKISEDKLTSDIKNQGLDLNSIQTTGENTYLFTFPSLSEEEKNKVTEILNSDLGGNVEELRFESVGPSIGPELIRKTVYALIISASAILLWVAYQFKSLKFGTSAVLANSANIWTNLFLTQSECRNPPLS